MTIKQLLETEKKLAHFINEIEGDKKNAPVGAFKFLTTAEDIIQNRRANMERKADCWNCRQPLETETSPETGQRYCVNCWAIQR